MQRHTHSVLPAAQPSQLVLIMQIKHAKRMTATLCPNHALYVRRLNFAMHTNYLTGFVYVNLRVEQRVPISHALRHSETYRDSILATCNLNTLQVL